MWCIINLFEFFSPFRLPHTYLLQQFEICMAFFARRLHYVPSMKSFRSLSHWLAYNSDVRIPSACLREKKKRNIHWIMNMQFSFHLFVQQIYCKIMKKKIEIIATVVGLYVPHWNAVEMADRLVRRTNWMSSEMSRPAAMRPLRISASASRAWVRRAVHHEWSRKPVQL